MTEVTQLLDAIADGQVSAGERLLPLVYDELRQLAAGYLADERPGQTLQPTALVHEAFVRLVGPTGDAKWQGRAHFYAAAARAMRRILIDNARRKRRERHGGARKRVDLPEVADPSVGEADEVLALDESLTRFAAEDPQTAELVQLHTFGGLSVEDAGAQLGLSRAAAYRQWAFARAWLRSELGDKSQNF